MRKHFLSLHLHHISIVLLLEGNHVPKLSPEFVEETTQGCVYWEGNYFEIVWKHSATLTNLLLMILEYVVYIASSFFKYILIFDTGVGYIYHPF